MPGPYRIRVYGKPRKDIDPALLAQVVILLGRHLRQQRQKRQARSGQTPEDHDTGSSASGDDRSADADGSCDDGAGS